MALIQVSQISLENEVCGGGGGKLDKLEYRYRYGAHIWPVDH